MVGAHRCRIRQNVTIARTDQLCEEFEINRPIHVNAEYMYANEFDIASVADTAIIFVFESKLDGDEAAALAVAPKILRRRTITKLTLKFITHDEEQHAK